MECLGLSSINERKKNLNSFQETFLHIEDQHFQLNDSSEQLLTRNQLLVQEVDCLFLILH